MTWIKRVELEMYMRRRSKDYKLLGNRKKKCWESKARLVKGKCVLWKWSHLPRVLQCCLIFLKSQTFHFSGFVTKAINPIAFWDCLFLIGVLCKLGLGTSEDCARLVNLRLVIPVTWADPTHEKDALDVMDRSCVSIQTAVCPWQS